MRLADLYGMEVRSADGERLGKVHEVRAKGGRIFALDYGRASLIERLTSRRAGQSVKWEKVARITADGIVLAGESEGPSPRRKRGRAAV